MAFDAQSLYVHPRAAGRTGSGPGPPGRPFGSRPGPCGAKRVEKGNRARVTSEETRLSALRPAVPAAGSFVTPLHSRLPSLTSRVVSCPKDPPSAETRGERKKGDVGSGETRDERQTVRAPVSSASPSYPSSFSSLVTLTSVSPSVPPSVPLRERVTDERREKGTGRDSG